MRSFVRSLFYLAGVSLAGFFFGRILVRMPLSTERYPFKLMSFERQGKLYRRLAIHRWQSRLPDISRILPHIVPPKSMKNVRTAQDIRVMLQENCIAEAVHRLCAAAGLLCPLFFPGGGAWIAGLLYALCNIPYILVQRYNRPRLFHLYQKRLLAEKRQGVFLHIPLDT